MKTLLTSLVLIIIGFAMWISGCKEKTTAPDPIDEPIIQTISPPSKIWAVYVGPSGRLYVGTFTGLYVSSDEGNTWTKSSLPLDSSSMSINCILEISPTVVFAGSGGCAQTVGIMKSTDGGMTFVPSATGITTTCMTSFAYKSLDTLFAGALGAAFRSIDGGSTWTAMNLAVTGWLNVFSLVYFDNGILIAGTSHGLFHSTSNGDTWTLIEQDSHHFYYSIARTTDGTVLAGGNGLFRSSDSGLSWIPVTTNLPSEYALAMATGETGLVFAVGNSRIVRSTDNGVNWTPCDTVASIDLTSIAVSSTGKVFLSGFDRLYWSTNNGTAWHAVTQ